jgi:hypothetical protein
MAHRESGIVFVLVFVLVKRWGRDSGSVSFPSEHEHEHEHDVTIP